MKKYLKELKKVSNHLHYYNKMAPFNVFDSEYVENVDNHIKMVEDSKKNYDDEPVVACKFCKNLHIVVDEDINNICMRCGSVNDIIHFENIYEYLKFKNAKNS